MTRDSFDNPKSAAAIVPSNTVDLSNPSKVYVGNGGTVKVTSAENSGTVTLINAASGSTLPVVVARVWSGTTTATNLIALW